MPNEFDMNNRITAKVDDFLEFHYPLHLLERGDPSELDSIARQSRLRLVGYGAALVVGKMMNGRENGALRQAGRLGMTIAIAGAWNNAAKLLLFGVGPDTERTDRIIQARNLAEHELQMEAVMSGTKLT